VSTTMTMHKVTGTNNMMTCLAPYSKTFSSFSSLTSPICTALEERELAWEATSYFFNSSCFFNPE
jgi:hypothetical protein